VIGKSLALMIVKPAAGVVLMSLKESGDPVLPNQGGRMMHSDPDQSFPVTEDELRYRAYMIFEERGRFDGRALDDWLAAEAEIHHQHELRLEGEFAAA
jgi:hypothetical protein